MAGGGVHIGTVYVKVEPDTKGFKKKVQDELNDIDDATINVDADTTKAEAKIDKAARDRKANIKIDVDQSALGRLQKSLARMNLSGGAGGGGMGGMGSFADSLALVAGVAVILAPAIALVTGLLATLPAVLSTLLVPIGAVMLGMDGIKEAAKVLEAPLGHLKEIMSKSFKDTLTPIFTKLGEVFPTLERSLPLVAGALGSVAEKLVGAVTSGEGLGKIQGIIEHVAETIDKAAPGVGSLTSGLLGIANTVTAKFPAVSTWFNEAAAGFDKWVESATKDGSLNQAMDTLGGTLKGLMDIGGTVLKQGFEWLSDPAFGKAMTGFVDDLKAITEMTLPGFGDFFKDIAGAVSDMRWLIEHIPGMERKEPVPKDLGKGPHGGPAGTGVGKPAPVEVPVEADSTDFWHPFTSPDAPWRGYVTKAEEVLAEHGPKTEFAPALEGDDKDFFTDFFRDRADQIDPGKVWENAKKWLNPMNLLDSMMGTASADTGAAGATIGNSIGASLGPGLQQGVDTAVAGLDLGGIGTKLGQGLGGEAGAAPAPVLPMPDVEPFKAAWAEAQASVSASVASITAVVNGLGPATSGAFNNVTVAARTAFTGLGTAAQSGISQMVAVISTGANQATAAINAMSANIISALIKAGAGAEAQGAAIGAGMARGIASSTGAAVAAAAAMVGSINAVMAGVIKPGSPSKLTTYYGETLGQGLAVGIDKTAGLSLDAVKDMMQAVKDVFGDASGLTINFNMGQAASSFGEIAEHSKTIGDNLSNAPLLGSEGPTAGGTFTAENQDMLDRLSNEKKLLDLEIKRLQIKKEEGGLTDEEKAKYDALKLQRDKIGLQKDELSYQKGIAEETGNTTEQYTDLLKQITEAAVGVGKEPLNQAMSDLNIGGGALTAAMDQGIGWATQAIPQMIFNVSSADDAIAVKNNQLNKQKLQYTGR